MKHIKLLILMIIISSCASKKITPTNTLTELDQTITNTFNKGYLNGVAIVVVDDKKIIYQKSLGFADLATKKPYKSNSVQNIASVSKTFLALAIMKAVDQGKVNLDDNINKYLPFKVIHPKFPNIPITLRHLTNHSSGIIDGEVYEKSYVLTDDELDLSKYDMIRESEDIKTFLAGYAKNKNMDESEFLKNILVEGEKWYQKTNFSKKEPGKKSIYSNLGATLAGYVIENAVGLSYEEYVRKEIFTPLKMTATAFDDREINNLVTRYVSRKTPMPNYHLITRADGGVYTNTFDFSKYLIETLNGANGQGEILTNISYKEMFARHKIGKEYGGIFWEISENGIISHNGADPGVLANAIIIPNKNIAYFLMTNQGIDINPNAVIGLLKLSKIIGNHNWK